MELFRWSFYQQSLCMLVCVCVCVRDYFKVLYLHYTPRKYTLFTLLCSFLFPRSGAFFYVAFFCPARRHGKCFSNIELMETVCGNFYIFTSGFSCKVSPPLFFMFIIWWHDLRVHRANFTCKFMWLPLNPLNSNGWVWKVGNLCCKQSQYCSKS